MDITPPLDYKEPENPTAGDLTFIDKSGVKYTLCSGIAKDLFPHQREGVNWMWKLHGIKGGGGLLADEMGLGKTLTVCSFISGLFHSNLVARIIIISPSTLIPHWTSELKRVGLFNLFTGYHSLDPTQRADLLAEFKEKNRGILLTTYGIAVNDIETIKSAFEWDYMIVDEGQFIKNCETQRWKNLNEIQTSHRIILSGAPIQNNLKELWTLLTFCTEHQLGSYKEFCKWYESPIVRGADKKAEGLEKTQGAEASQKLKYQIKDFFLRRSKDVISAHNENRIQKAELVVWLQLTEYQRSVYWKVLEAWNSRSDHSSSSSEHSALPVITSLRHVCDHPLLVKDQSNSLGMKEVIKAAHEAGEIDESCKIPFILSLLRKLIAEKHSILIFSETRMMLDILEDCLTRQEVPFLRIDGLTKVSDRSDMVEKFQNLDGPSILLLTSSVGGVGLTLTMADRVIIVAPSWNPSTDDQCIFRAYRIGQRKSVIVYRLVTCGTIEERIYKNQVYKVGVARIITEDQREISHFSREELGNLFYFPNEEDYNTSYTQLQLKNQFGENEMNSLERHVTWLKRHQDVAAIGDHSLLFNPYIQQKESELKALEEDHKQKSKTLEDYWKTLPDKGKKLKEALKTLESKISELKK